MDSTLARFESDGLLPVGTPKTLVYAAPVDNEEALHRIVGACQTIQSQSQSYFTTGGLPTINSSWRQAPSHSRHSNFIFQLNTCGYGPYITSSLTGGWVCNLQLLLAIASAGILRSDSCGTRDHNLLSQIRDSPNLGGQVPVFISPRNRVPFSSPPTTRRTTVEVFDPASTRESDYSHLPRRLYKDSAVHDEMC
jgi:hypothetical protein